MRQLRNGRVAGLCCAVMLVVASGAIAQEGDTYEITMTSIDREKTQVCFEFSDIGTLRVTDSQGVDAFVWSFTKNGKSKKNFLATADAECVNTPNAEFSCSRAISGKFIGGGKAIKGDVLSADFLRATYKGKRVDACSIVPETSSTLYMGTFAGGALSGRLDVFIKGVASDGSRFAALVEEPATAVCLPTAGELIRLFGQFDPVTQALFLQGADFSLDGSVAGQVLSGTFAGPEGTSGSFSAVDAQGGTATNYCGTWDPDDNNEEGGTLNLTVSATGQVVGVVGGSDGSDLLTGQLTGTSLSVTGSEGTQLTGTLQGNTLSGTWADPDDGSTGTFSTSTNRCG